jgi:hypothetical protein
LDDAEPASIREPGVGKQCILVSIIVLSLVLSSANAQIERWSPPVRISSDSIHYPAYPSIAAGPTGNLDVVWMLISQPPSDIKSQLFYSKSHGTAWLGSSGVYQFDWWLGRFIVSAKDAIMALTGRVEFEARPAESKYAGRAGKSP